MVAWERTCTGMTETWLDGQGQIVVRCLGDEEPPVTWPERLIYEANVRQSIQVNPHAALLKRIRGDGFAPTSPEFDLEHEGIIYRAQRAECLLSGDVRVYYAELSDWSNVRMLEVPR